MNKTLAIVIFLLAISMAVLAGTARADICEICQDVINEFSPSTTPYLANVELKETNNVIRVVGHDSHGLKSLSISCQLLCGKVNEPCCFDEGTNKWKCAYNYLYCDQQNESGTCRIDSSPPSVSVQSIPASAIPSGPNCTSYIATSAQAYITCLDNEGQCTAGSEKILLWYADPSVPASCPSNPSDYNSKYFPASGFEIVSHSYVCGAATDLAGNPGFSQKPVQFCVDTDNPYPPSLLYEKIGGTFIDLVWYQYPLMSDFDRYELYSSTQENFPINPSTRYGTYTNQNNESRVKITGLQRDKKYCFKVLVFDKTLPKPFNSSSNELCVETLACDNGEITQCFRDNYGIIQYGNNVTTKGVCKPGNATCSNGQWGYCENQTGPFIETCNGLDDDCDGYVDNQWPGESQLLYRMCTAPGICGSGYIECKNGNWQNATTECSSLVNKQTEICDGRDNDCNGVMDDVDGGKSVTETRCGCYGGAARTYETCNGIDDDCSDWSAPHEGIDDVYDPSTCACYRGAHMPGQLQETCNSIDDNCNNVIDDPWISKLGIGWPAYITYCGTGTRCEGGHWECNATNDGAVCSTIGGSENVAQTEICDGIDNDCDGSTDEGCQCSPPGTSRPCGLNKGECRQGAQYCEAGTWGECKNYAGPKPEVCNGRDDDCDGVVDNVHNGTSVETTKCACYNHGDPRAETCNGIDDDCDGAIDDIGGGNSVQATHCGCYNGTFKPGQNQEICNSIDDDCNGAVDDKWPDLGKPCGTGVCSGGVVTCAATGNYTVCSTTSYNGMGNTTDKRGPEICNGLDDDCNGVIDDINGKQSVDETYCGCYGGRNKTQERCNHIDDDCNGKIDDNLFCVCYEGQAKPCGSSIGACTLGQAACVSGVWGTCAGGKGPTKEVCNMIDDDCNGVVDDVGGGYSVEETQCGCYNGRKPSVEVCDGIDNDCNGKIDDDIDCKCDEGQEMQCGSNVGECTPGVKKCIGGRWGECSGGVLPQPEVCDGADDDCNGVVDDVDGGNSIGSTQCACYNRFAMPGTQTELCGNGIDDDCNGFADESCIGEPGHCQNGIRDGGEEGVDCGGPCKNMCSALPSISTWLLIFALLAGIIAVFAIFFSSFWKSEKKSLFDRMGRMSKQMTGKKIALLAIFLLAVAFLISQATSSSSRNVDITWTCDNGGFTNCYKQGCMTGSGQLRMYNNEYQFNFGAPRAGNYTCTITAAAGYFDYPPNTQETQEVTDIYLNDRPVGSTQDKWCPPGGKPIPCVEPKCTCSVAGFNIDMCYEEPARENMAECNKLANCNFMYGEYACGGTGCCTEITFQNHCEKRLCSWENGQCKPIKRTDGKTCEEFQDSTTCNDYSQHPGMVCCWNGQACITDQCPTWYTSRVDYDNIGQAKACCEGTGTSCSISPDFGLCEWDDQNQDTAVFPCRCASNPNTNPDTYISGGSTPPPTNHPPSKPDLAGSSSVCDSGVPCEFKAVSTDQDNDQITYIFDWGDSEQTTRGPYQQGVQVTESHTYPISTSWQYYTLTVIAKDDHNAINATTRTFKVYGTQ